MRNQHGVGLIEVIIAVLVLAIAILGSIAMQYRSLELATQALKKVEAVNLASNLAERMYVNRASYTGASGLVAKGGLSDCITNEEDENFCDLNAFAKKDIADIEEIASQKNMKIDVLPCPDTKNERRCIYVAWDETEASQGSENDNACTTDKSFSYLPDTKCVVVETFQ
ncbi:type IV pilus modification protein PilV [Acinetobacter sp. NIPH 2377]|uniref:type IV pilus modification protein PilV n=1 Tax=Acinetobacter terrestris TaxID=2529843 RepID=UPI00148F919F|nr:type IV pilus modification protein PilV [Acinetobacter terrestris]NNH34839.1 type IV pilus modification protein PilV [Acinetobacter terrestris]